MLGQAEYIWLDGAAPTQGLRSKTRIVDFSDGPVTVESFPEWSYDGSSTYQADGGDSDLMLQPVSIVPDPLRGSGNYLVLCEVFRPDGTPHETNSRAQLRDILADGGAELDAWIGFEQEYTLMRDGRPLGFPADGFPAPQGPYYCSVGNEVAFGRDLVEAHTKVCIDAGLMIYGVNAEVMPGQWEFQIGYRGITTENADPLTVSDHLQFARWLIFRLGEAHDAVPSFDVKPMSGDWNGAGCHTNFSTTPMRHASNGMAAINDAIGQLERRHMIHIVEYGAGLADRLTGLHETSAIDEFRGGVADRGASIRIPRQVEERGSGYLEDRRPGANCDPYRVTALLLEAVSEATETELALAS